MATLTKATAHAATRCTVVRKDLAATDVERSRLLSEYPQPFQSLAEIFTESAQATGLDNIGQERTDLASTGTRLVNSRPDTTL